MPRGMYAGLCVKDLNCCCNWNCSCVDRVQ